MHYYNVFEKTDYSTVLKLKYKYYMWSFRHKINEIPNPGLKYLMNIWNFRPLVTKLQRRSIISQLGGVWIFNWIRWLQVEKWSSLKVIRAILTLFVASEIASRRNRKRRSKNSQYLTEKKQNTKMPGRQHHYKWLGCYCAIKTSSALFFFKEHTIWIVIRQWQFKRRSCLDAELYSHCDLFHSILLNGWCFSSTEDATECLRLCESFAENCFH